MACINRTLQTLGREIGLISKFEANHWQLGHFYSMSTMSFVLACFNLFVYLQSLTNATDLQVTLGEIGLNNLEVDANRQRICQCEYRVSENVMGKRVLRVSCHSWGCLISITKNNKSKCRYVRAFNFSNEKKKSYHAYHCGSKMMIKVPLIHC